MSIYQDIVKTMVAKKKLGHPQKKNQAKKKSKLPKFYD